MRACVSEPAVWTGFNKQDRSVCVIETDKGGGGGHLYLGYKALGDGHRVGVTLLQIVKQIPETNTALREISILY